ncbi:MAG: glycosyltransferase family 87 protein [Candidatus Hinthialibacter antarcticus]|nr:glycosyltransferase family 87 protein [Candidatus Hinthialibacter antarcticus]
MNRFGLRSLGWLLCIIGFAAYVQHQMINTVFVESRNDFKHLYIAGYLAWHGGDMYDSEMMFRSANLLLSDDPNTPVAINPFVYPPFFALTLAPMTFLPYDAAWYLFNLFSHVAYLASLALLVRCFRKDPEPETIWWGLLLIFSAAFFPLQRSFWAGQMNTYLLLCLSASAYALHRNKEIQAGFWLGLGAAIKVSPAFLLLFLLYKRKWKGFIAGMILVSASVVVSIAMLGWEVHAEFIHETRQMSYGSSTWANVGQGAQFHIEPHNQAPSAVWYRFLTQSNKSIGIMDAPALAKTMSYLTALLIVSALIMVTRPRRDETQLWEFSLWGVAMLLLPSLMWDHYLVQAMLAFALALRIVFAGRARLIWLLAIAVWLCMVPYNYWLESRSVGWGVFFAAPKLYGLLCLSLFLLVNPFRVEDDDATSDN